MLLLPPTKGVAMKSVLITLGLVLALMLGLSSCVNGTNVYVFGDSLVDNSRSALTSQAPGITINAFGGTAVCDWNSRMKAVADQHPRVVIASFVGNSGRCAGVANTDDYWRAMFLHVLDISNYYNARHVPLYWAGYPVAKSPSMYSFVTDWYRVQGNYQYAARQYPTYVHWFDAGLTVAPNHVYTSCINGKTVRQPDGLHLTPYGGELYAKELLKPAM
jgi:hypothetical protein